MARLPAYAVNGGQIPAEMLRRVLWATSSGANGVVGVYDLTVTPLPALGPGVQIGRGGALATSRTAGTNEQESYLMVQDSASTLSIPTGFKGYVIARIDDWHFTGEDAPADPVNALYWNIERVSTLDGITYPYVALAYINLPAGVSKVTASHITDKRNVAMPRRERYLFTHNLQGSATHEIYEQVEQYWPAESVQDWEVYIPTWATRANVVVAWNGVSCVPASGKHGVVFARIGRPDGWGQGNVETQHQHWDLGNSATGREHWEAADDVEIPEALRGTTQRLRLLGFRLDTLSGQAPKLNNGSSIKFDVEFLEVAPVRWPQGDLHI